jgi:hypothetical protein
MRRVLLTALLTVVASMFGPGLAPAQDCTPHCGYIHDYGPYDFTYIRPGLFGYALCHPNGDCLPHLAYSYSGYPAYPRGRITIRTRSRPAH